MGDRRGFAAYVEPLLPALPTQLIDAADRVRIAAAASLLPADFAFQTYGFEYPLGRSGADFLVSAVRRREGAAALAAAAERQPDWVWAGTMAAAMASAEPAIDDVWLEFDLTGARPEVPNLFCRPLDADHAVRAAVELLTQNPAHPEILEAIRRVVAALPPRATLFQIGVMRARPAAGVRLCVNEIALDAIPRLLGQLDFAHAGAVEALLARYQPAVGDVTLGFDLCPGLGPKIGLECYFAPSRRGHSVDALLARFLDLAIADGACTPEEAEALKQVERRVDVVPGAGWPDELLAAERLLGRGNAGLFRVSVHHVKLVYQAGTPLAAKAYVSVRHESAG